MTLASVQNHDQSYRITQAVRDRLVFAPHNLLIDPPFGKLDVLSCRNVLIYFEAARQRQLMPIFHRALRRDGLLFLGATETIGGFTELFATVDNHCRIYRRKELASGRSTR